MSKKKMTAKEFDAHPNTKLLVNFMGLTQEHELFTLAYEIVKTLYLDGLDRKTFIKLCELPKDEKMYAPLDCVFMACYNKLEHLDKKGKLK